MNEWSSFSAAIAFLSKVRVFIQQKTIDILKFDIERSEWPALAEMLREQSLRNVKQLLFEIHVGIVNATVDKYKLLHDLETIGFRKFSVHVNHYNRFVTSSGRRFTACYELSYININFLM